MTKEEFLSGVVFTTDKVGENPFCYKFVKFKSGKEGELLRKRKNVTKKSLYKWEHFANVDLIGKHDFHAYYSLAISTGMSLFIIQN